MFKATSIWLGWGVAFCLACGDDSATTQPDRALTHRTGDLDWGAETLARDETLGPCIGGAQGGEWIDGRHVFKVGVLASGKPAGVNLYKDTIGDSRFARCVQQTIMGWRFSPPGKNTMASFAVDYDREESKGWVVLPRDGELLPQSMESNRVRDGARQAMPALEECAEKWRKQGPEVSVRVALAVIAKENGNVQRVVFEEGGSLDAPTRWCIEGRAKRVSFREREGAGLRTARFGMTFVPSAV